MLIGESGIFAALIETAEERTLLPTEFLAVTLNE
jgi:hypothetical protein